ncbi:chloride channel protein [Roseivirga ehrenbergii]|uniref:Chloride channel protein n=1 Tax=Roseivirga ehrenbergii (strain DSM 102268 / JCM 13514 / KCTC 12282 / NCIMB 14502 / KMM 6017) TaxID=279360 RepID=A0A150XS48_ROSEK|nr:chloride channel protein [Roseivirga ehrenbergii]KYG81588.1 chloride channel protein [Roseivirga ehrenbergii]
MKFNKTLSKFLIWRIRHISTRNFLMILSGVIGLAGGIAAVILKSTVHYIQHTLSDFREDVAHYLFLIYPLIGIVITSIVADKLLKEKLGHGITSILYTISKKSSIISRIKTYSSMVTSAITVGFGGSVGLEAPIVVTGSAIGSNIGQLMHLSYKQRTLMIGCGAAAAISGIFNSPVAGVIFSIEVILTDVTIAAFIPLLIASVIGSLVSMLTLGSDVLFSFNLTDPFLASDFPYFLVLGALCGLVSVYFTRLTQFTESVAVRIKNKTGRAIVGGLALGIIIFVFHPIYGEGYDSITTILNGNPEALLKESFFLKNEDSTIFLILFSLGILLIKPIATGLTLGAGGSGGIFAPSLFIGAITGYIYSQTINFLGIGKTLSISNFTLVGMCGVMSGVLHAPLTAIFLIAEITSGYTLFLPLMLVSAIGLSTSRYFEQYSFYTGRLIKAGDLITNDKDRQVLSLIKIEKLIETDLLTIHQGKTLGDLVTLVRKSKRNIFPVVNDRNELQGIITLDDIREIMFDPASQKSVIVATLMHKPPETVFLSDKMEEVMTKFEKTGAWNLPVIEDHKYVGIVSKSRIFNAYRTKLKRQNKE